MLTIIEFSSKAKKKSEIEMFKKKNWFLSGSFFVVLCTLFIGVIIQLVMIVSLKCRDNNVKVKTRC